MIQFQLDADSSTTVIIRASNLTAGAKYVFEKQGNQEKLSSTWRLRKLSLPLAERSGADVGAIVVTANQAGEVETTLNLVQAPIDKSKVVVAGTFHKYIGGNSFIVAPEKAEPNLALKLSPGASVTRDIAGSLSTKVSSLARTQIW